MSQNGYLIVTDIVGYTAFLTHTELEHAQSVINDLLNTLIDNIEFPLVFSKLEGDAIFAYAPEGSFVQGQTLLEQIENLYCIFSMTLETMHRNTICSCQACRLMTTLDLKFVVHYGTYSLTKIDDKHELMGSDIMILRELFKSPISDAVGMNGFAFITAVCADAMRINSLTESMKIYSDNYENFGEIRGFVHDLQPIWKRERERRRIMVNPEDTWLEVETYLPVPSAIAWVYVTEPRYRKLWLKANNVTVHTDDKGRIGIGTTYICAHGKFKIDQVIIDWHPFEYLTVDTVLPLKGMQRHTTHLTPNKNGTHISWRFEQVIGRNRIHTTILRLLFNPMKGKIMKGLKQGGAKILEIIENDR